MKWSVVMLLSFFSFAGNADSNTERQETQLRIQPVGQVTVQGQPSSEHKTVAEPAKKEPGEETYEQHCIVCHKDGLAGAPKFRNEQDWKSRIAGRTLDDLVASSIKGLNAMPTKGTCFKCSEDDLKAAISYMLPRS
ncbi:c-type cytochrome [Legionella rowbothamii]|uniref:c-type cytochrome n=1 Tax=Legionella rowbothamii TaxID=96229 RepID=UPI0010564A4D|nr:c-type cytochrome [Legionella rowbothamii]